jgi:protein-disulfide isomerase
MLHLNFTPDYDHYLGCPLAPIELIQYGDFQCEYCAEVYPIIKLLQDSFGDRLRFVYRHYTVPTRHPLSPGGRSHRSRSGPGEVLVYARYDL